MMANPAEVLRKLHERATQDLNAPAIKESEILARIDYVCRCPSNRAGVRLLMACMLGKLDNPLADPRQPYTEIGGDKCFSGRTIDEQYITSFITAHNLPCNSTTAFLTPALRNINRPLTTDVPLVGRPPRMYGDTLKLLEDVAEGKLRAEDVLTDAIRILILVREERVTRMASLLADIERSSGALPLSSEMIVTLIEQHLACKNASRLPVLVVAAAYQAAANQLGAYALPLQSHNAADEQTGAMGDVEICLTNEDRVVTIYEMKKKEVTIGDLDRALQKIASRMPPIDNYVFITTEAIDEKIQDQARTLYEKTAGTEVVVLDCIGFVRHFLHLFHRARIVFLNAYQALLLAEPDSSVRQPLKEAFLSLRQAAESDE
jgi:hypothetical protein